MQYLYHIDASESTIELRDDAHRYIFKVRRHKIGETIYLRNLSDKNLYSYNIESLDKKEATLRLMEHKKHIVMPQSYLHIGWCMIDSKSIEKVLPSLNEMGVARISFIYCARSQKQFKLDLERLRKITLNSSQQCGRSEIMQFEVISSLEEFLAKYPQSHLLNFSQTRLSIDGDIQTIVIGCEGGLSSEEEALFAKAHIVGLDTPLILKSESAVCAVASKLLL